MILTTPSGVPEITVEDKAQTDKAKKFRSPQFPFISLEKAVARARDFEGQYRQHDARVASAAKTWGYAEKSSGGVQTIAALVAYGLMEDEGSLDNRRLKLTPLAATILKDTRAGAAPAALKTAALKPKVLADLWLTWGAGRPPDHECISTLVLDRKFSEEAARRLLGVYDATIRYAGLALSDKVADNQNEAEELETGEQRDKNSTLGGTIPPPLPPQKGKVPLMQDERVLFSYDPGPDQRLRIVVAGEVDAAMADAIKAFGEFQATLVGKTATTKKTNESPAT